MSFFGIQTCCVAKKRLWLFHFPTQRTCGFQIWVSAQHCCQLGIKKISTILLVFFLMLISNQNQWIGNKLTHGLCQVGHGRQGPRKMKKSHHQRVDVVEWKCGRILAKHQTGSLDLLAKTGWNWHSRHLGFCFALPDRWMASIFREQRLTTVVALEIWCCDFVIFMPLPFHLDAHWTWSRFSRYACHSMLASNTKFCNKHHWNAQRSHRFQLWRLHAHKQLNDLSLHADLQIFFEWHEKNVLQMFLLHI